MQSNKSGTTVAKQCVHAEQQQQNIEANHGFLFLLCVPLTRPVWAGATFLFVFSNFRFEVSTHLSGRNHIA